jgi:RecA/RadA recombinase
MAKKTPIEKLSKPNVTFSELNDALSKISPTGAIIEDSIYAKIDEWIPTGSYILNAAMSGSLFGGMPNRRSLLFAGSEGSGKTFLTLSIVRNAQAMGYFPIYYDSEGSIDIDFVKRLGIDTSKFRIENISTVEEFATLTAKLNETIEDIRKAEKTPPKVMVILDSLGNLSSIKEKADTTSGSDKRDMTKQQAIRRTFRVIANDFAKNGIPFVLTGHVYAKIGSYIPGDEISGGGGGKYSASIIFVLTKSKLTDKDSEEHVKKIGLETAKVGIVVTVHPYKQRFARPIKVQIHIPFYKKPNPYVGLEKFVNWETCGVVRGKTHNQKEYEKLKDSEKKSCFNFEGWSMVEEADKSGNTVLVKKPNGKIWVEPRDTSKYLVCKHLGGEISLAELYTDKVFTDEVLHKLDENIIKRTFQLPNIESLEDLAEITGDLLDDTEMGDINIDVDDTALGVEDLDLPHVD